MLPGNVWNDMTGATQEIYRIHTLICQSSHLGTVSAVVGESHGGVSVCWKSKVGELICY